MNKNLTFGPLMIAIAASLWATDALFRWPIVQKLDPTWMVFIDHFIILVVLSPFIFWKKIKLSLTKKELWAAMFVGIFGSGIATVLFSLSFRYTNPSVSILLQKLQPILTASVATVFLKEKLYRHFYLWAILAFGAGMVLSFPDLDFSFLTGEETMRSTGALLAFFAALMWSLATIGGKYLLKEITPWAATYWRFLWGWIGLGVLLFFMRIPVPKDTLMEPKTIEALLYMSLIPGLAAVATYYQGLKRTKASIATFVELIFPVAAVVINTLFLDLPLNGIQMVAAIVLLFSVTMLSREPKVR